MMRNIVTHLPTIDEAQFERVKAMCLSLGEVVVKPLAEALSVEERARPRQRLTTILIAFGAVGKRTAERLKSSPNAAVRRTAIYLLREFGGSDALPDLTELLDDNEPQVQREAVRAILNIGTEQSYQVLETGARRRHRALARGDHAGGDWPARRARDPAVHLHRPACEPSRSARRGLSARHRVARRAARSRRRSRRSKRRSTAASGGRRAATPSSDPPRPKRCARIGTPEAQAVLNEAAVERTARRPDGGPCAG